MSTDIDVWRTFRFDLSRAPRDNAFLRVVARLRDGARLEQAQAELDAILLAQRSEFEYHRDGEIVAEVRPMHADIVAHFSSILLFLLGAVTFVLLIACANVANLLLVRAAGRERELAIRAALGGDKRRLVQQLLTESTVFALSGGLLGLLLARWGINLLLAIGPANLPRADSVPLDANVLWFTFGATLLSAILFGLLPALQASRTDLYASLADRGGVSPPASGRRLREALVVGEVAVSMVLLVGAGLMLRSFVSLQQVDLGFSPEHVQTFRLTLPVQRYPEAKERTVFYEELGRVLEAEPVVERAAAVFPLPFGGRFWTGRWGVPGREAESTAAKEANYRLITSGYFDVMGTRLIKGRTFKPRDNLDSAAVVVIDQTMAEIAFPGADPVGESLQVVMLATSEPTWVRVVGVVDNIRHAKLDADGRATIYYPYRFQGGFPGMTMVVRSAGKPAESVASIRRAVYEADPNLPLAGLRPLSDYVNDALATTRFVLLLIAVFAVIAVLLASTGLYGVLASAVRTQTREIGVHMAFGASREQVLRRVLLRGLRLSLSGILLGLLGSLALTRVIASQLAGVSPTDPVTLLVVAVLLGVVATIGSYVPARRALRAEPMSALRYE